MISEHTQSAHHAIFSNILCGVDGTRSAYEAVRQSSSLLSPEGRLTLLAATESRGSGKYETALIAPTLARRALDHARRLARKAGVDPDGRILPTGPAQDVLLGAAGEHSLLAIGAPGMSRLAELLLGGVATAAAHTLPCSLLVARRPRRDQGFGERIMVASDASERSDALVTLAADLADARGASLVLFHAPHAEGAQHPTRIAAQSRQLLERLGERATVVVEPGRAAATIAEVAEREQVSLLLVASRRLEGLRALGSVSERLVHSAPCSVLVLRPEDLQA
ncbi:MAG: universal stress protein [Solirubrobacteraceae bacterium]